MSQYSNQKAYDDLSHKCKNIANKALEHFPKKGSKDEEDIIVYIYDFLGKMLFDLKWWEKYKPYPGILERGIEHFKTWGYMTEFFKEIENYNETNYSKKERDDLINFIFSEATDRLMNF